MPKLEQAYIKNGTGSNLEVDGIMERFDKEFNNRIGSSFECCDAESLLGDVKSFLKSEINNLLEEIKEKGMTEDFFEVIDKYKLK